MYIYVNQLYMEFFGYDDIDDLICIFVLDIFIVESQGKYREFMKFFFEKGEDGMILNCMVCCSDDYEFNVIMFVFVVIYDGEVCIQIVFQFEYSDVELEEKLCQISSQDLFIGLFNC